MRDTEGILHSLQFIDDAGEKRFLAGGRKRACYFAIGRPNGVLCVAEGFATAASVHEATGHAVAVAFDAGNLTPVAVALRAKYPDLRFIVCGDDDYRTAANPGLTRATEAARAVAGVVALPDFGDGRPDGATDFNDLHVAQGLEAVRRCIIDARDRAEKADLEADRTPAGPEHRPDRAELGSPAPGVGLSAQPDSVDLLLTDCGIASLTAPIDFPAVERALRELRVRLQDADATRREVARAAVIAGLKALKVTGVAKMVDAAIGTSPEPAQEGPALLRDDEPWPDRVEGAAVLDAVVKALQRYLVLPEVAAVAIALWIAHSYAMAAWSVSALLAVVSPTKRCGKTTLLLVVEALARRCLMASNLTPAVLFRLVDAHAPTLLADEADTWLGDESSELRGIFNSGHTRAAAVVWRCVGDDHEVKAFSTWTAKAIGMIGRLPGTMEDRSIVIELQRKARRDQVTRLRQDRIRTELEPLRRQLRRWTDDHLDELAAADPQVPAALNDRAQDSWRPLLAVADAAGCEWPERARGAALALSGVDVTDSPEIELLGDIRTVFQNAGDPDALLSKDLLKALEEMEDRPWAEWSKGKPLTGAKLARMLKPFKVYPAGSLRVGAKNAKGYRRESFLDAWARYIPDSSGAGASQRNNANDEGQEVRDSERHGMTRCDGPKGAVDACKYGVCDVVTDRPGSPAGGEEEDGLF